MYFFLPSWYSQGQAWRKYEECWYQREDSLEFDDTVGQIRLFSHVGEPLTLVAPAYTPCLRRLLHRLGLGGAYYWSVFDVMQGIRSRDVGLFSYKEMGWPAGIEWAYTALALQGYLHGELFCQLEFGSDGSLIFMDRYKKGKRILRNYFDDRGFLSSKVFYSGEEPRLQEFFDEAGVCQFKHDLVTDEVVICEKPHYRFEKKRYSSMALALAEILIGYLSHVPTANDTLVVASDPRHNSIALLGRKKCLTVLSFYEKRYPLSDVAKLRQEIGLSDMVVTDTQVLSAGLKAICGWKDGEEERAAAGGDTEAPVRPRPILDISPYDARLSLGHSQSIRELRVLMPYDAIDPEIRDEAMKQIFTYMVSNRRVVLLVGTSLGTPGERAALLEHFLDLMEEASLPFIPVQEPSPGSSENEDYLMPGEKPRIVLWDMDEGALFEALSQARLVVDVTEHPSLYMQIAAISAGVPQVGFALSQYVENKKNGYIIRTVEELGDALSYFLDGLANWNKAMIFSIDKIAAYSDGRIVERWLDALDAARYGRDR